MHNFISVHRLRACLSVDKDVDQTAVGCASGLVPDWALLSDRGVSFRLGRSPCCSCALVCRMLNESVEEEAPWHLHGHLPLLKSPEALIKKRRKRWELFGLTYQSDSADSELQPLPQEPGVRIGDRRFPRSGWRLKPRAGTSPLPALPALGGCCLRPRNVFAHQPFSSVVVNSSWVLAFFFFLNTFKSEPYCMLKRRRFLIQIPNVLVWINNTVASKVPAAKGKLWLPTSTKLGLRGETWHVLLICLLSSRAGVRRLHVLGL